MNREGLELKDLLVLILFLLMVGCATHNKHHEEQFLGPPANADPVAVQALLEGNKLFAGFCQLNDRWAH